MIKTVSVAEIIHDGYMHGMSTTVHGVASKQDLPLQVLSHALYHEQHVYRRVLTVSTAGQEVMMCFSVLMMFCSVLATC